MEENVERLKKKGFTAVYLGTQESGLKQQIMAGKFNYRFGSPESLTGDGTYSNIFQPGKFVDSVKLLVIDESHCIKKWGMDEPSKRKEAFRKSYGEIGTIRSSLGNEVPCLALTATATKETRRFICENLGLNGCHFVNVDADKQNIRYSVMNVDDDHRKIFQWLVDELNIKKVNTERHIVFCHRADDMKKLFRFFSVSLHDTQYVNDVSECGNSNPDCYRIFAMYHQKTNKLIQETVSKSFSKEDGIIRVLFCTIAFGMGIDVKGVSTVIHYGPAKDIDDYMQESGRAGRDPEKQSLALLLNYKGSTRGSNISAEMRNYTKDKSCCKRLQLLKELQDNPKPHPVKHNCCSFCSTLCRCDCACLSECQCSPCSKNQSTSEQKLRSTYMLGEYESSEDESADKNELIVYSELFDDLQFESEISSDSESDVYTNKPVIYSSSSDEN